MKTYPGTRTVQATKSGDKVIKAAIVIFDSRVDVVVCPTLTTENIAVARLTVGDTTTVVASVYFEDYLDIEPYLDQLREIVKKTEGGKLLVGGDVNAWSTWWGSEREDERGRLLSGTLDELNLHVLNCGNIPTFDTIRGGKRYRSTVDITACSDDMLRHVDEWRVETEMTSSDHNAVILRITAKKGIDNKIKYSNTRVYNTKKADWKRFREEFTKALLENKIDKTYIDNINSSEGLGKCIEELTKFITETCDKTVPRIKKIDKTYLPWWNEELDRLKKSMCTKKRRIRCAAPRRREWVVMEYLKAKEEYESQASKAQTDSWKSFCGKQDKESVWDGIYRVILKTKKRHEDLPIVQNGEALDPDESARVLAETFFPEDEEKEDNPDHTNIREAAARSEEGIPGDKMDPPFTLAELRYASRSFNPKKAPGPDGFTADICEATISSNEQVFLAITNKCLELSCFPEKWKEAAVVVLRKPGKDNYTHPKSYRPIGLLPVLGKILEKMLVRRLRWHMLPQMNPRQYGFVPQRSTEDALYDMVQHIDLRLKEKNLVVVVSLDIEGAFDSAWWPAIKSRLVEKHCPLNLRKLVGNYLKDRGVAVRYAGAEYKKRTSKGCVQGSIAGPTFWNILLNPLLDELEDRNTYCQAFADDVVLIFSGKTALNLETEANTTLAHVQRWGVRNKLKFAPHKTHAMLLTKKLKFDTPRLHMGGVDIALVEEIKLLGLIIDRKMTFRSHVTYVCKKAVNIFRQLSCAAKVTWGLNPEVVRVIYTAVVEPVILYAAGVWARAADKIYIQNQLNTIVRGFARKISKSYRTVSLNSALILTGLLPLDLRVKEAASLYEAKRGKPQPILGGRPVEEKASFRARPHPADEEDLVFQCLENDAEVQLRMREGAVQIFTDGSKIEGKVGAALSWWNGASETKTKKYKLEEYCTVFQAELYAVYKAMELIAHSPEEEFSIFSDSRSTLELMRNGDTCNPLVLEIKKNVKQIRNSGKDVQLYWVKAHVGIKGNERADELAKLAALKSKRRPDFDKCPVSFVKRTIRSGSIDEWEGRYQNGSQASVTKLFFPTAKDAYRLNRHIQITHLHTQLFTGHGGFSQYLSRFKKKDSPACICDPVAEESILHLIVECPVFGVARYNLENDINIKLSKSSISTLMISKETRNKFLDFCLNIIKTVIYRNKT